MTQLIRESKLGSKVRLYYDYYNFLESKAKAVGEIDLDIIGVNYSDLTYSRCVGAKIKNKPLCMWDIDTRVSGNSWKYVANIKEYSFGYWLRSNFNCTILNSIICPNQKCVDCNRTAPHASPNFNDRYICSICKVLREL